MSSRLVGAILALTAAALLAASIVTSGWWSGHPKIDGRTISAKDVYVGLHGAEGCNTGGDQACTPLELPTAFTATGYVALGASSVLTVLLVLLALTTYQASERRKLLAWAAIGVAGFAAVVAIALIAQGPKVKTAQHVSLPIGYGIYLFFVGVGVTFASSVLAQRPIAPLQPRPSRQPFAPGLPPPHPQQLDDVIAMLPAAAATTTPPAAFAPPPETLLPAPPPPPPAPVLPASPGGSLPGPAGPLGPGYTPSSRPKPPTAPPPPRAKPSSIAKPATLPPPVRAKKTSVAPLDKPRLTPPPPKPGEVLPATLPVRTSEPLDGAMTVEHRRVAPAVAMLPMTRAASTGEGAMTVEETPSPPSGPTLPRGAGAASTGDEIETVAVSRISSSELDTKARPKVSDSDLIAAVARDSASELETIQREKLSARELAVGDSTSEHALASDGPGDDARAAEANATALSTGAAVVVPVSTAPASLPPPAEEPVAVGPSPACPQCEAPMSWVEEHLRFYCKSCRMYF